MKEPDHSHKLSRETKASSGTSIDKYLYCLKDVDGIINDDGNLVLENIRKQHKLVSEDLSSLIKPKDYNFANENFWEAKIVDQLEDQAMLDLEYEDIDKQFMAINAPDDPILESHARPFQCKHSINEVQVNILNY